MDARRAEIDAKRARLEEMRRRREEKDRAKQDKPAVAELTTVVAVLASTPKPLKYSKATQTEAPVDGPANEGVNDLAAPVKEAAVTLAEPLAETLDMDQLDEALPEVEPKYTVEYDYDPLKLDVFLTRAFRLLERVSGSSKAAPQNVLVDYTSKPEQTPPKQNIYAQQRLAGPVNIASLDWSPHHANLFAVAHGQPGGAKASRAFVWSLEFPESPEYTLCATTDILHIKFSPTHPWLVFGAGYNGQLMAWDLRGARKELLPYMRSHTDGSGHLLPVCGIAVASFSVDLLLSCSSDGQLATWPADQLTKPDAKIALNFPVTSVAVRPTDSSKLLVGSLQGTIHEVCRTDTVAARAGTTGVAWAGHTGPVTAIDFAHGVFISSSLDWTVKIWREDALVLDIALDDAVSDVAWHPQHAGVFAAACQNKVQLWNLSSSVDEPTCEFAGDSLVTKLQWDPRVPTRLLCGCGPEVVVLHVSPGVMEGEYAF